MELHRPRWKLTELQRPSKYSFAKWITATWWPNCRVSKNWRRPSGWKSPETDASIKLYATNSTKENGWVEKINIRPSVVVIIGKKAAEKIKEFILFTGKASFHFKLFLFEILTLLWIGQCGTIGSCCSKWYLRRYGNLLLIISMGIGINGVCLLRFSETSFNARSQSRFPKWGRINSTSSGMPIHFDKSLSQDIDVIYFTPVMEFMFWNFYQISVKI